MCEAQSEGGRRCPGIRRRCIEANKRGLDAARQQFESLQESGTPAQILEARRCVALWEGRYATALGKGKSTSERLSDLQEVIDDPATSVLSRARASSALQRIHDEEQERMHKRSQEHQQEESLRMALVKSGIPPTDVERVLAITAGAPLMPKSSTPWRVVQQRIPEAQEVLKQVRQDASTRLEAVKRSLRQQEPSITTHELTHHPEYTRALMEGHRAVFDAKRMVDQHEAEYYTTAHGLAELRRGITRGEKAFATAERSLLRAIDGTYTPWRSPEWKGHHAKAQEAVECHKEAIAARLREETRKNPRASPHLNRMAQKAFDSSRNHVYEAAFHASVRDAHRDGFESLTRQFQALQRDKTRLRGYEALAKQVATAETTRIQRRTAIRDAALSAGVDPDEVLRRADESSTAMAPHREPRTARLDFGVTSTEVEHLRSAASKVGVPLPEFVRARLLGKPTPLAGLNDRPRRSTPGSQREARSERLSVLLTRRERETIAQRAAAFGMPVGTYGWAISTPTSANTEA